MKIETISLNKLIPSAADMRKTGTNTGIDELAASIAAHGLLQNLQVRPGLGGKFEVVAGRCATAVAALGGRAPCGGLAL
jgi:ParB family transcriptional regulator, chromosome partitioning protein